MMDVRFSLASYLKDKAAFLAAFALFVFLLAALLLTASLNAQAARLECALAFLFSPARWLLTSYVSVASTKRFVMSYPTWRRRGI